MPKIKPIGPVSVPADADPAEADAADEAVEADEAEVVDDADDAVEADAADEAPEVADDPRSYVEVYAPNPDFDGETAGFTFVKGVAQVKAIGPIVAAWLERKGYVIVRVNYLDAEDTP